MKIGITVSRSSVVLCLLFMAAAVFTPPAAAEVTPNALTVWGNTAYGISPVPAGTDYVAVAAGGYHDIALKSDGSLVAWGGNSDGECDVPAGTDFTAADAGYYHSVALRSDGSLVAWGFNGNGQADAPVGNDFAAVSAGAFHNVALKSDGSLFAWGYNGFQECAVPDGNDYTKVSAGGFHSVALKTDGSLFAWGNNEWGQCDVPSGNDFVAVSAGLYHNVALRSDGSLATWGDNYYGQSDAPAGTDYVSVDAGGFHCVALKADGTLTLWGDDEDGQCSPAVNDGYLAVSAGYYHSSAIAPPLTLTSIDPRAGLNTGTVSITNLAGSRLAPGATVKMRYQVWLEGGVTVDNYVEATDATVVSPTQITCTLDLTGIVAGQSGSVIVTNPDGQSAELRECLGIYNPAPVVTSITPNTGYNSESVTCTITGEGFYWGHAMLTRSGESPIYVGTFTVKSPTEIECVFDLSRRVAGVWDLGVAASGSQYTILPGAFTILESPPTVTINKKSDQADPTSASPINFTVMFGKSVADFTSSGVAISGTAGATTAVVTGSGTSYNVAVSGMTSSGSVIASIPAGVAHDADGRANFASTSTDNQVNFQADQPTVTIDQESLQADPTHGSPIRYRVVFGRSVTGFKTGDVVLSGTAGAINANVSGSGTTYYVNVSGMTVLGTVIAEIPAGAAQDSNGYDNIASTSTDNCVTYIPISRPVNVSMSPNTGPIPDGPNTYTFVYSDSDGYAHMKSTKILFNSGMLMTKAVLAMYDVQTNKVYLNSDKGSVWGTGYAPGTDIVLQNSQGYVYVKDTTVSGDGDVLTVNWRIELKSSFVAKGLRSFMYADDIDSMANAWKEMGLYFNPPPHVSGINPSNHALPVGTKEYINSSYYDEPGYGDMRKCYLLINNSLAQTDAMFLCYDQLTNKLYLKNDTNTSWGIGCTPGTDVVLSNSQCDVYARDTAVSRTGLNLNIKWCFLLKPTFGAKSLMSYMYVTDSAGSHDGWKKVGTHFTPVAPTCVSITPSTGYVQTGTPQIFTTQYADPNGFANLYQVYMQISQTSSQVNAILVKYDAQLNKVYLKDDANTTWGTGYTPGTDVILENTQCILNVKDTQIVPSGANDLMIDWNIEFKPTQIGKLLCERMYAKDNESLNSAWKVKGYIREQ